MNVVPSSLPPKFSLLLQIDYKYKIFFALSFCPDKFQNCNCALQMVYKSLPTLLSPFSSVLSFSLSSFSSYNEFVLSVAVLCVDSMSNFGDHRRLLCIALGCNRLSEGFGSLTWLLPADSYQAF